uniref:Uncharacterized protein n=1 Tax=Arundo donax TaxID=35708 RepID=A0A0A8Z2H3_ARUDO
MQVGNLSIMPLSSTIVRAVAQN